MIEPFWPYLVVVLAGFVPNEVFRLSAVLLARRLDPNSAWLDWVRIVAITLLAAVVSRLIYAPAEALAAIPMWLRIAAIASGVASFFIVKRSVVLGIVAGEIVLIAAAWAIGRS